MVDVLVFRNDRENSKTSETCLSVARLLWTWLLFHMQSSLSNEWYIWYKPVVCVIMVQFITIKKLNTTPLVFLGGYHWNLRVLLQVLYDRSDRTITISGFGTTENLIFYIHLQILEIATIRGVDYLKWAVRHLHKFVGFSLFKTMGII